MTTTDTQILHAVEDQIDEIVELAEKCVDETGIAKTELKEHQLRNLENIANATNSVKALELFVRYQMGRHKEWRYNDFGSRVIEDFERLKRKAQEVVRNEPDRVKGAHLQLIRLYLGFLVRAFVAKQPRGEGEER